MAAPSFCFYMHIASMFLQVLIDERSPYVCLIPWLHIMQAINTVVAGILHDVIDDTSENLKSIEEKFGDDVASLVSGVSKLSYINQVIHMSVQRSI